MEKISDNHQKMRMIKAKTLLKEVDESIHFEEWIHNPTKILGYTASPNVISSALGIILTGLVLAMEGLQDPELATIPKDGLISEWQG